MEIGLLDKMNKMVSNGMNAQASRAVARFVIQVLAVFFAALLEPETLRKLRL